MKPMFFAFALALFWSSAHAEESGWTYSQISLKGAPFAVPNLKDNNGKLIAYLQKGREGTTFYFIIRDDACSAKNYNPKNHFVLISDRKDFLTSFCVTSKLRVATSSWKAHTIKDFEDKNYVTVKEVYPDEDWKPINAVYSAKNFKSLYRSFASQ